MSRHRVQDRNPFGLTVRASRAFRLAATLALFAAGCPDEVDLGAGDEGRDGAADVADSPDLSDAVDNPDRDVAPDGDAPTDTDAGDELLACGLTACPPVQPVDLPDRRPFDAERARRGAELLAHGRLGGGVVPTIAIENLWLVWGTGPPADYWARFRTRYGFYEAPGRELPMGIRDAEPGMVTFDCLMCHATEIAGTPVIGVGNSQIDLQGLYDDLVALNEMAPSLGYPSYEIPFEWEDITGAAGAHDGMGLGMTFATLYAPPGVEINTRYGYQQAPAWWSVRHRDRLYTDGSGQVGGYRTMMATLLGFGLTLEELQAQDEDFVDLYHFILSLQPPAWPFEPPDAEAAARGRALFDTECAGCHGVHTGPSASYPDLVVDRAAVGTDPVRAANFGADEVAFINASWFGADHPMEATGGYLAPPLVGVWATAPYLHNGSVPDLASLLDSAERPARWRRTGSGRDDYDPERVGWRYTESDEGGDPDTLEGRRTYDSARPGLSNAGHDYATNLTADQRADLLEYLKTL